jgi:hypothetical protein
VYFVQLGDKKVVGGVFVRFRVLIMVLDFNKLESNLTGNSALSNVSLRCNQIKSFNFNLPEVLFAFPFYPEHLQKKFGIRKTRSLIHLQ